MAQGLRAAQARHRPRTGRLGTSSPPRASSRKFRQNSNQAPGQFGAHSPPESQIHRPNRCARSLDLGRSRSRQEPLCPPSAGSRGLLPKLNNKWWDGYQSQKVVIMEDVDKETVKFLHHHLKIWADRWGVHWRDQGGAVAPIHRWLVVTSNYSIMDILKDLEDRQLRRPSLVGSCGLRCSAATRSRTGTPTRPSPPRLWPPSLNE